MTAPVVITLPRAAVAGAGRVITIRNAVPRPAPGGGPPRSTEVGVVVAVPTDLVEGQSAINLDRNEMATFVSNGTDQWLMIAVSDL